MLKSQLNRLHVARGSRPLTIKLVRHGESVANIGIVAYHECSDFSIKLSPLGHVQALRAGEMIGSDFIRNAHVYSSPYVRARDTLKGVLAGANIEFSTVRVYEDPRLREVEHGYSPVDSQSDLRKLHGRFFYRFAGGESAADCFDRVSSFL
jgi:broad specificity phosphatase PhoE